MPQDYNATLNLPKTEFPMRAGLPKSEPETLKNWEEEKIYEKLMEKTKASPSMCSTTALRTQTAAFILVRRSIRF